MGSVNHEVDAAKKRLQVVQWLNTLYPDFNLPLDTSDEQLRAQLLDGVVLCAIINRKNWGSIQSQRGVFVSLDQRLYNVKRFLTAIDEMGLLKFNVSDLEQGYMSAVLDCLLSLRDRMGRGIGEGGICDSQKFGTQPRKVDPMDVYRGNHIQSMPHSRFSRDEMRRSLSESKLHNVMQNPIMSEPSAALLHPLGHNSHEVFQLHRGRSDLPTVKVLEMMKSNTLDNAPTQSLLSVVNGILDESIERMNGELPQRVAYLVRKVIQEIERRFSTQADHIRTLPLLADLDNCGTLSWCSTILAYLYDELSATALKERNMIVGCLTLLQLWSWSQLSAGSPTLLQHVPVDGDRPLGCRNNVHVSWDTGPDRSIKFFCNEFDLLDAAYVQWCPYTDDVLQALPQICTAGAPIWRAQTPMSCFNIVPLNVLLKCQNNLIKAREEKYQSRIKVLETLASGTSEETQVVSSQLQKIEMEKTKIEEIQKHGDQDMDRLMREKDNSESMISELKQELENTKKFYDNRCKKLERETNEIKAQLEERIKEAESVVVESKKRTKELETFSETQIQKWNKKEHVFQNFIGFQLQSVKNMRVASETIKQEVTRIQEGWREEMTSLGEKLKVLIDAAESYHAVLAENRRLYNDVQELKGNIRVSCRIRPFLPGQNGKSTTVEYIGENGEVLIVNPSKQGKDGRKMFKFNKAFGPASTQEEVYLDIQPLVRSVLDGYNVCIFAYGQTGSGKTYTMSGPDSPTKEEWGVNYRALNDLFNLSHTRSSTFSYEIGVQMVEIYNEQVRDLLTSSASQKKLGILSCSQPNGLAVPDASMLPVKSTSDVLDLMQFGQSNRAMSSTAMNERSSRSHSVVTIHVEGMDLKSGSTSRGCLHLIDLAGSERVDRSEVKGDRLKEAQHINKSLAALGDVIFALAQKNSHVPYRNSKLTQVLQSSLGGHAKTLMFVQVNPDVDSYLETVSTLKFAERVSGVELGSARNNKEGKDIRDLMEQVASLQDTIARKDEEIEERQLLKDLKAGGSKTLRHSLSSPGMASSSGQHGQRLGKVARFTEKLASDPESSELSEGRQSDISDGGLSVGAAADNSIVESHLPEAVKPSESTKENKPGVSSRITKPRIHKTGQAVSIRPKLKEFKSPVLKRSTTSQTTTSSPRSLRR